jgi:hypothetical protein
LKQLLEWLGGENFDGIIVFDECHKAKNLVPCGSAKPTKTGLAVLELQEKLPNARIVYASATGASEPKNMAYMVRLGLWGPNTPFADFNDFIQSIEKRGVGAMEIVAMDMKLRGMYMARQLSFNGVSFSIEEIPLRPDYVQMYDNTVKLWVEMKENFQDALDLIDHDGKLRKTIWGQFWSSHQRFFKYLCMACKVPHVVELARKALKNKKCVVIGLQSTGEARTLEQLDECGEISDFISTARGVLQNLIEKYFPLIDHQTGRIKTNSSINPNPINTQTESNNNNTNTSQTNGGPKSKNSQRVNSILQRLSSYTNQTSQSTKTDLKKSNNKSNRKRRSSSMSSLNSNRSSGSSHRSSPSINSFKSDLESDENFDEDDNVVGNDEDDADELDDLFDTSFDDSDLDKLTDFDDDLLFEKNDNKKVRLEKTFFLNKIFYQRYLKSR